MVTTEIAVAGEQWGRIKTRLRDELGEDVYSSWFARLDLERIDGSTLHLSTPTLFIKQWIQSHYGDKLVEVVRRELAAIRGVNLSVRGSLRPLHRRPANCVAAPVTQTIAPARAATRPFDEGPVREATCDPVPARTGGFEGSPLDPRFTLDTFEESPSNALALAAARQVAFAPRSEKLSFNPLYVHAPVGYGKTHLLQAVAAGALSGEARRRVLYLTAEHFMYRFVAALKSRTAIAFKDVIREIDLLLIDDLQFLNGGKVQEEFCHTMNTLVDGARQVVIAADRPPAELDGLDQRVRSRLSGGLLVELGAPDYALRRKILQRRIAAQKDAFPALDFPEEVLDFVARSVTTNGRELDGAVNRLVARNQLTGARITLEMAETALRDLLRARETRRLKIEDIQRVVGQHYNVSKADLLSARRNRAIVRPRQIAMYLCKLMTPRSLPEIGRRFGGRDHTTVLHAVRKVEELVLEDKQIAEDVETLKRLLEG